MRYYKLFPNATLYIIDSEAFMQKSAHFLYFVSAHSVVCYWYFKNVHPNICLKCVIFWWVNFGALIRKGANIPEQKVFIIFIFQGIARTQSPTTINYAPESPTFGAIAKVSQTGVQW